MATITTKGTLFNAELTKELFDKVQGHSAIAKLCGQSPMPFAGTDTFVFTMDGEVSIVGEGGQKPAGEAAFDIVTIKPIKVVYQHRLTDEFINLAEEKQLPYLSAFTEGFAKKIARGFDIMAIHGVNPADNTASTVIGNNCFDKTITATASVITYDADTPDDILDLAVYPIRNNGSSVTGVAMSPQMASDIGRMKTTDSNLSIYPEFRFGGSPSSFNGIPLDVNDTVSFKTSKIRAIVGDFANAFRWGFAEQIPLEIIEYGDPDGQGDLKRLNQVVLRSEAFIGWGILDSKAFSKIETE